MNNVVRTDGVEPASEALFIDGHGGDSAAAANQPEENSVEAWLGQDGNVAQRPTAGPE